MEFSEIMSAHNLTKSWSELTKEIYNLVDAYLEKEIYPIMVEEGYSKTYSRETPELTVENKTLEYTMVRKLPERGNADTYDSMINILVELDPERGWPAIKLTGSKPTDNEYRVLSEYVDIRSPGESVNKFLEDLN